ncbi:MAG: ethylbenzene dehydrogenase-related protein [Bradyrhizobium sp.]
MRRRKTDYGTIILHWVLAAASGVALFSGLRIATEMPDQGWLNLFDAVLPRNSVWVSHMQAAIVLVAVSLAYTIYLIRSGLSRRVALDKSRLRGLLGRRQARLGSISVILTWGFFVAMLALIASGSALYFGIYAGHAAVMLHWYATWLLLAFTGFHVLTHYRLGGSSQLLRIFRPQGLPAPPAKLDAVELLTLLVEQSERLAPETEGGSEAASQPSLQPTQPPGPVPFGRAESRHPAAGLHARRAGQRRTAHPRNPTLQSNPFVVAAAMAITCASVVVASDWLDVDSLKIHRIAAADAPVLDGDTSDRVWRNIEPFSVMTNAGDNFDGKGESRVDIRAVHDGTWAYFLFTWEDPTRSLKQLPLIKQSDGWHLLHKGFEAGDEHEFNEDKFSVLLTTSNVTLAGDRTFHAGLHPIADAPATMTGRGLHFTTDGGYADVWEWKATSGGPTGWMDDTHFGPPLDPTPTQAASLTPYRGGFAPDPGRANYTDNFVADAGSAGGFVRPLRLPTDLAAMATAMGEIALDPDLGESEGARWFMTAAESAPYSVDRDRGIPAGTVIPGVIIDGDFSGDRADIRCAARWASGHWALEVARRLDTHSRYDVPLQTGVFMRVAAFDHSQIRHTRHVRPIRLEVE